MRKLTSFTVITLNGYYKNLSGDISWHQHGAEENAYSAESLKPGNTLLFGRVTYQEMASYWPTQAAFDQAPVIAAGMNKADKIVFSRTLENPGWQNSRVIKSNMVEEIKKLKETPGSDLTLLGSGSILMQLAENDLVDDYQIMLDPVAIGAGTTLFANLEHMLKLKLKHSRPFKSGVVLLHYEPCVQK